eukprot:4943341-Prymnesium_polylepis.1
MRAGREEGGISNLGTPRSTRPVYTEDPGDPPGYVTEITHHPPSIATRVLWADSVSRPHGDLSAHHLPTLASIRDQAPSTMA